jgi:hypothetical protein
MSWNQSTAAAVPPAIVTPEDTELFERWSGGIEAVPAFHTESDAERCERLLELSNATLSVTICGDVEGTITVDLPCEVIEERPGDVGHVDGEPPPLAWLIARVEAIEPVDIGFTQLTSFSIAIPGHVGPGLYLLDDLRRRAESDEVEWWEVDDFHLSPSAEGGESTYYLDDDALDGAWVATTGASIAFDVPMASVLSEIRVTGTITWAEPGDRPRTLAEPTGLS